MESWNSGKMDRWKRRWKTNVWMDDMFVERAANFTVETTLEVKCLLHGIGV